MLNASLRVLALAAAPVLAAAPALAATIDGGVTEVEVTADLGALGLAGAPFGSATVDATGENPVFGFPITGGTIDDGDVATALIEHEGSGVTLSAGEIAVTVGNFLISVPDAVVSGDVIDGPEGLDLFDFGEVGDDGIELLISGTLAGALTDTFGAPDLSGAQFGIANASPELAPIPLPAAAPLLLAGLGAIGFVARRRARA